MIFFLLHYIIFFFFTRYVINYLFILTDIINEKSVNNQWNIIININILLSFQLNICCSLYLIKNNWDINKNEINNEKQWLIQLIEYKNINKKIN